MENMKNEVLRREAEKAKSRLKFDFPYDLDKWIGPMNMMMENYHKHTDWSNLVQIDSATSANDFIHRLQEYGCKCFFSGEHGYQGEWLYIYDLCKNTQKTGSPLRFRYSVEAYWVKNRLEKDNTNNHMVLVARNYNAARKLNYILSMANVDGYYYKPRIDLELLFQLTPEDVYVTTACIAGWKYPDAEEIWLKIAEHFGDSFFLEYQPHHVKRQEDLNRKLFYMSKKYGLQTIIGLDTHYLNDEDRVKRDNLLIRKGIRYEEEDGFFMDFPTGENCFTRMREQGILPDQEILYAMMNTHVFLNGCKEIELDTSFKIPVVPYLQDKTYEERVSYAKDLFRQRFHEEPKEYQTPERLSGLEYEESQIFESGTVDYFLSNYEIIKKATSPEYGGQLTTTSRGSASSFYISKLLGFTTMDRFDAEVPIYPERFLTKDRILASGQMPDVDYNCSAQEPFVKASRDLIGQDGCYPLLAVGKLGEKSGFKLYADINGIEPSVANEITSSIDLYNEAIKQADDEDKDSIDIEDYIKDKEHLRIFKESKPYQGIVEQARLHACGHLLFNGNPRQPDVVGYGDIRYEIGLIRCVSESTGKSFIVACVEGSMLDPYGYVKNDYLIVDVVGIIYKLYHALGMEVPPVQELRKMVAGDSAVWGLYANGITCCLNQCERASTTKKVMQYKPQNIKELAAFIAGIRPGFKSLLDGFIRRIEYTNGEPAIDKLLEDCFHYMLYQEAVMKIFSYLGIPMKDSYDTIKKISKKKLKGAALEMVEQTLKDHWLSNIGNLDNFDRVYKVVKDSARYSFNAPHALAMANDSLYEAWVKAHHPSVFYEVTLNHYQDKADKDKVSELINEAVEKFGYSIGSYEYGKDNSKFTVDDQSKTIYPSLASIKGIGFQAASDIVSIYQSGADNIVDIFYAIKGTKINGSVFRSLIKIDYFKAYGPVKKLLAAVDIAERWWGTNKSGRKTISKTEAASLPISEEEIKRYATDVMTSGKVSGKQYKIFDFSGFVKAIVSKIPDDEFDIARLAKMQYEILGYVDRKDPTVDWNYVFVEDLNTRYSPKFRAYCLKNGKTREMKIHKKKNYRDKSIKCSFEEIPIKDGDVIYIKSCRKESKRVLVDGEWTTDPEIQEWWIKDYSFVC